MGLEVDIPVTGFVSCGCESASPQVSLVTCPEAAWDRRGAQK